MAQNVIINGVTYNDVPYVEIPKGGSGATGTAKFYDTSHGDIVAGTANKVLSGYIVYGPDGEITGQMTNVGTQNINISAKSDSITITEGYHTGSGKARILSTEQDKIIAGNIRSGVTILGVAGSSSVLDTTIPSGFNATAADIISGKQAYANGALITGTATVPTVSQDATSKVLTIQ